MIQITLIHFITMRGFLFWLYWNLKFPDSVPWMGCTRCAEVYRGAIRRLRPQQWNSENKLPPLDNKIQWGAIKIKYQSSFSIVSYMGWTPVKISGQYIPWLKFALLKWAKWVCTPSRYMILIRAMIGRVKEGIWILLYRNILHCMFLRVFISLECSVFIGLGSCLFFWGMGGGWWGRDWGARWFS